MKTFEYLAISFDNALDLENYLTSLGKQGWELASIYDAKAYLKREKQPTYTEEEEECSGEWSCGCEMCMGEPPEED